MAIKEGMIQMIYPDDYISHHGILGQRWGIRRYQPYSQVPRKSGEGGKEIGSAKKKDAQKKQSLSIRDKIQNKRMEKEKLKKTEQAKKVVEQRILTEQEKERILKTGTPKELKSIANTLSNTELDNALKRIELNVKLDTLMNATPQSNAYKAINDVMGKVKDVNGWVNTGLTAYGNYNRIRTILEKNSKSQSNVSKKG